LIYVVVLFGSLLGIVAVLGVRVLMRNRAVRRFVRGMKQRTAEAEDRGLTQKEEKPTAKPRKNPRVSAIELQQVRSLIREAEKFIAQNKLDEAERVYIQALTIDPYAQDVQAQLAKLYLSMGREPKAEALYKELLQRTNETSFHSNLGLAYYRQGKYVDACHSYQNALNLDPTNPERSAALGKACIAARRFEEAAPLLAKASSRLSRDVGLLRLLADCYLQLGHLQEAEEVYRRINKLEPYNEEVKQKLLTLTKK